MTAPGPTRLIVNGDDFGRTEAVNAGIVAAYDRGILTSASLMVRWPSAAGAAREARARPGLGVGLHVDLGEWAQAGGDWVAVYEVLDLEDPSAVAIEVRRQLAVFRRLSGGDPTHLDSHQHVHRREPVLGVLRHLADRIGVPLRHHSDVVRHCGEFYGQDASGRPYPEGIAITNLRRLIAALRHGVTELACHPGLGSHFESSYGPERVEELRALCDPSVRRCVEERGVELCSFADLRAGGS